MKVDFKQSPVTLNFQPNAFYDRLISMRRTDRRTFDSFSTPTHLALAEYEKSKREHDLIQEDVETVSPFNSELLTPSEVELLKKDMKDSAKLMDEILNEVEGAEQ
jgi:L-asparaginase/Glu-tRNA(Gln) amidotransferase subunit D